MNNPPPILSTSQIREVERVVLEQPNAPSLMEQAGLAAATIAQEKMLTSTDQRILVVAGPGNNGGDAMVAARHLKLWGYQVTVIFTGSESKLSSEAKEALEKWFAANGTIVQHIPTTQQWDIIIDGLFGIGLTATRPLNEHYQTLINTINRMELPILSLDVPSGLDADTGNIVGAIIKATITATFIGFKPGLLTHNGCDYSGKIILCDLGLNPTAFVETHSWLLNFSFIQSRLPVPRQIDSHKGSYGSVGVIGGATGMIGAALLAGSAALKLGAGRVYIGLITNETLCVDVKQPELMIHPIDHLFELDHINTMIVGPGLGVELAACMNLEKALRLSVPIILDADALNLVARYPELQEILSTRSSSTTLTPHVAEAARLLGVDTTIVQANRIEAIKSLVERFNCAVLLKGAGSICSFPNKDVYFNTTGNPGLSSAGTGDILSGMIAALIAQNLKPENALLLAVFLHGAAADTLLKTQYGPIGMTASEIIDSARRLINQWVYGIDAAANYLRLSE